MTEFNKRVIFDLLNSIYDDIEDDRLLDKLSEVMEIIQDMEEAIPIHFMLDYLRKLQEFIRRSEEIYQYDCFTKRNWPIIKDTIFGLINDWRLSNGQQ